MIDRTNLDKSGFFAVEDFQLRDEDNCIDEVA